MEEGGEREGDEAAKGKDSLRDCWRKLVESEERLKFFKRMVGMGLEVREIEHLGEDIRQKFRSEVMKSGKGEQVVLKLIMKLKLCDKRRHQR